MPSCASFVTVMAPARCFNGMSMRRPICCDVARPMTTPTAGEGEPCRSTGLSQSLDAGADDASSWNTGPAGRAGDRQSRPPMPVASRLNCVVRTEPYRHQLRHARHRRDNWRTFARITAGAFDADLQNDTSSSAQFV